MSTIDEINAAIEQTRREQELANEKMARLFEEQRQILAEEAERKRKEELERETEVRVKSFEHFKVTFSVLPTIRPDILDILRRTPGRIFNGYEDSNSVPVEMWEGFRKQMETLTKVKITHIGGVEKKLNDYLTQPEFTIQLYQRFLLIKYHPKAITGGLVEIPGIRWKAEEFSAQIPISEGWRLLQIFDEYTRHGEKRTIVWEDKALELVQAEAERRVELDKVVLNQDVEMPNPFLNGHELRPFQKVGVKFLELSGGRALLADQMGLGKTWQAAAFALRNDLRTIVICPAHLKSNWAREIYKLTGKLPMILSGRDPDPHSIAEMLTKKPQFSLINYDIIGYRTRIPPSIRQNDDGTETHIPETYRYLWAEMLALVKPDLVILDEAHYIKNTSANRTQAILQHLEPEHRIPMTGTPVLNRIGEYYSILHWVRPDVFPSEERFYRDYTYDGKRPRNVEHLRDVLKPVMLRRLKKDVVADLPPLQRITEFHDLSDGAQNEYRRVLQGVYRAIDEAGNRIDKNVTNILVEIGKLKEVCAHDKVDHTVELAVELYDSEDENETKGGCKKVLIFSQFQSTVRKIKERLGESARCWTGETPMDQRTYIEHQFQNNPDVKFLVVSLMTGQTGLNLTAAGHIIFNDLYWTPAAHAQAEERAYGRLNDLHGADSYYVVATNTIEDWIQELLQKKLSLINQVVEGIDAERDVSIGMAIIERLKAERGLV